MVAAGRGSIVNLGSLYATVAPEPRFYDHLPGVRQARGLRRLQGGRAPAHALLRAPVGAARACASTRCRPAACAGGQDPEFLAKYCARVPLGRMAEPADLGGPLVFLASDASRYVTGHELRVDGGFTA